LAAGLARLYLHRLRGGAHNVSPQEAYCAWSITSNIALGDWGRYLGDATLTAAILDRLAMHAIRVHIAGPSFRQHVAKSRAERAPTT